MEYALFIVCASAALLGTLVGFGGGIFVVPIMVLGFQIPIEVAIGVTAMSLFPSSLISSLSHWKNKNIDFKLLLALEPFTMLGAFLGALVTSHLPSQPLKIIFSGFLLFISYRMHKSIKPSPSELKPWMKSIAKINLIKPVIHGSTYKVGVWAAGLLGILAGGIAGLFGIGGGVIKTPLMLNVFKVPVKTATATSLAMIMITSLISGTTHFRLGHYTLPVLIPSLLGFSCGAIAGLWIGVKLKDLTVMKAITGSLFLAGIATLTHALL